MQREAGDAETIFWKNEGLIICKYSKFAEYL